jgi:hypothetical protein
VWFGWWLAGEIAGWGHPGAAGFGRGGEVGVIVAAEDVALRGEVLDGAGGEAGAGFGRGEGGLVVRQKLRLGFGRRSGHGVRIATGMLERWSR